MTTYEKYSDACLFGSDSRAYRAKLFLSVTEYDTYVTIRYIGVTQMRYAYLYGVGIQVSGNKISTVSAKGYLSSNPGATWTNTTARTEDNTVTIYKTSSEQTATFTAKAYGTTADGYGSAGGSGTSVSYSVTIPALETVEYTLTMSVTPSGAGYTSPSVGTHTYEEGTSVQITATPYSGYKFSSWSINGIGNASTSSSTSLTVTNGDWEACAVFEEDVVYYNIYYYYESGSIYQSVTGVEEGTLNYIISSYPTKTGYDFLGWSTSQGGGVEYTSGSSFWLYSNLYLYPVYSQKTYTVTYNANGGSGAPSAQTKYYGTALTLSSTTPTRSGYTFLGWGTSASATSATYAAGDSYTSNASITLFAVWKSTNYTVTYDANGGSGAPSAQTEANGTAITIPTDTPVRTGYTFLGWSKSASATSATYQPGESYTGTANVTLYAVWKIITYTVTYNGNGGSGVPSKQTKTYDVDLTLSSTVPTRTGHDFIGWGTSASEETASYQPGSIYIANAHITLYALWVPKTYAITYNANGGSGAPEVQTKTYGVALTISDIRPIYTGHIFDGWATTADATAPQYQPGGTFSTNATTTLYAIWSIDSGAPGTPSSISAIRESDTSILLSWINNPHSGSGLTGTRIEVQTNDGSWSENINTTTSATQTFFTHATQANNKYYYRLLAYNDIAEAKYYGYTGPIYTTPTPPEGYGLKINANIRLSASAANGKYITSYVWEYSADGGSTFTSLGTSTGSMTHTPGIENPVYRVASINMGGLQSSWTQVIPTNSRQIFFRIPDGFNYQGIYVWKD